MRKLNDAIDRFCALHPRLGIPGLMRYIVAANAVIFGVSIFDRSGMLLRFLAMDPQAVLRGEIWRLVTYVLIPTGVDFLIILTFIFYYWLGESMERLWGSTKFTVYYVSGMLLSALASILVYLIDGIPMPLYGAIYVNTALFLAYVRVGAEAMARMSDVPPELVSIVQSVVIMLVVAEKFLAGWKHRVIAKQSMKDLALTEVK